MRLIDRLEIEQARSRILEGHFDNAEFHLASARRQSWRLRVAKCVLRFTPRLAGVLCRQLPAVVDFLNEGTSTA